MSSDSSAFQFLTIDVGPLLNPSATIDDKERVISSINKACRECGLFMIVNHGIDKDLIERFGAVRENFFHDTTPQITKVGNSFNNNY
jgi:isopenicillin N synthase-like dioxygenase